MSPADQGHRPPHGVRHCRGVAAFPSAGRGCLPTPKLPVVNAELMRGREGRGGGGAPRCLAHTDRLPALLRRLHASPHIAPVLLLSVPPQPSRSHETSFVNLSLIAILKKGIFLRDFWILGSEQEIPCVYYMSHFFLVGFLYFADQFGASF